MDIISDYFVVGLILRHLHALVSVSPIAKEAYLLQIKVKKRSAKLYEYVFSYLLITAI